MASKPRSYFVNETRKTVLADSAAIARSMFGRMKGLLGVKALAQGEGLYIVPCNSIHMIGMQFSLDAVFLDKSGTVVGLLEDFRPGRISRIFFAAHGCLEVPAGTIARTATKLGDKIFFDRGEVPAGFGERSENSG